MRLRSLRFELVRLHLELRRASLVAWTSGNVSGRDPDSGLVAIKPSGVAYDDLTAGDIVVLDLDGNIIEGSLTPSSDTQSHLVVYRERPDVHGVAHTHSRFATAFAAVGRPIPVFLTAHADEFGGEIPVGDFAAIGDESIGLEIVRSIGSSPAILMKNHGVFAVGPTAEAAVKAAVMTEDIAATVWAALQIGTPELLSDDDVRGLHHRYKTAYGQGSGGASPAEEGQ